MFRSKMLIFVILIFGVLSDNHSSKLRCNRHSDDFKCRLASMTPYRYIANHNDAEIKFKDCQAKKIWLMIRHGTRNPGKRIFQTRGELEGIKEAVIAKCELGSCKLTREQLERLRGWKQTLGNGDEMLLVEEGEDELIGLGERFQARFPQLMPEQFDNTTFKFKFTQEQRTKESAKHFTIGLFGKQGSKDVWYPPAETKDPILRFYKACDRWQSEVKKNPKTYEEEEKFKTTHHARNMLENISNYLGMNISFENARLMRDMCAYETAWSEKNLSPWCDFFTPEDFKILEFAVDLKYYWVDGYGFSLTYEQACNAVKDMFEFVDADGDATTTAYFTHSGTLLKLLSLLGVSKDEEPMRHHQYPSDDRLWRTSFIDAFATNVAFVSFDCKSTGRSILVMHQERIINLPGCPDNHPCPLSTMKDQYPDRDDECQFHKMCNIDTQE